MSTSAEPPNDPGPRRDQGFEIAVARVGRPNRRGRLAVIGWLVGVAVVVGVALGGRDGPTDSPTGTALIVGVPRSAPPLVAARRPDGTGPLVRDIHEPRPFLPWWPGAVTGPPNPPQY